MKKNNLIVGTGDVGQRLLQHTRRHANWSATTRRVSDRQALKQLGASPVLINLDRPRTLRKLRHSAWNAIVYLAPPPTTGQRDLRLRHFLNAILPSQAPGLHFVYVSTTGVYGDCGGNWVSESRPVRPQSARAKRRVDAEQYLSRTAKRQGWHLVILRAPGIYSAERLPVERLRTGIPAIRHEEDSYTNHIHADDLARLCWAATRSKKVSRAYNACDNSQLKMGEWFDQVAQACGLGKPPRLARSEVPARVSTALWSFMCESRRLSNARLLRELRIQLLWPTTHHFFRDYSRASLPDKPSNIGHSGRSSP